MNAIDFDDLIERISTNREIENVKFIVHGCTDEELPYDKVFEWELARAKITTNALRRFGIRIQPDIENNPDPHIFLKAFHHAQMKLVEISNLSQEISWQTNVAGWTTKAINAISNPSRSAQSATTLIVPHCSAGLFYTWLTRHFTFPSRENSLITLLACPDHYLDEYDSVQERLTIAEVTGGSPFINRFHITFGDPTGIRTPADPTFAYQMIGTARLDDGTSIGGVRHQFRDIIQENGVNCCEVRLCVEFPEWTPSFMVREHQIHLAVEFVRWFQMFLLQTNEGK
jgi:hypothetical protein